MGKNTSSNKEELISALAFASKDRVSKQLGKRKRNLGLKSVTLGWMNFDSNKGRNVSLRYSKGGGTRTVNVSNDSDIDRLLEVAKGLFSLTANHN